MKKILLTGGGTAGHVTPNIALLPDLKAEGYDIHYIGSYEGMEKKLITAQGIHYDGIATGKFRRYLSAKNLSDPFRVIKGFQQAKKLIRDYKPDVVFSKGGFVACCACSWSLSYSCYHSRIRYDTWPCKQDLYENC